MDILKKSHRKFVLWFIAVIISAFVLFIIGTWLWQRYDMWRRQKAVQNFAEALKKAEVDDYNKAMADTYGGKTPQETLQMYIDAVEKGDYELASKYFIGDNQGKELKSFDGITEKFIKEYIGLLKNTLTKLDTDGRYDIEKKYFSIYKPIGVRMKLYPNGIWKIIEI